MNPPPVRLSHFLQWIWRMDPAAPRRGATVLRRAFAVIALAVLLFELFPVSALAGPNRDAIQAVEREFNLEWRSVRHSEDPGRIVWVEHEGVRYAYSVPLRLFHLSEQGAPFQIDDIDYKQGYVRLEMKSQPGTRVDLNVYDTIERPADKRALTQALLDDVVPMVLARLFEFGSNPAPPPITVNTVSGLIHSTSCNHLPKLLDRLTYEELSAAEAAGYRACSICFTGEVLLQLPDYARIRREAIEASRLYEIAFPLVEDLQVQMEVQRAGERILETLPFEPKGFTYQFRVVQSSVPNAVSYATGFVYVTSTLYDAIEDPRELDFVLAHEIAHCEFHYEEYARSGEGATTLAELEVDRSRRRDMEMESDLGAIVSLMAAHPGENPSQPASLLLRKLQYFALESPIETSSEWTTHRTSSERISFLNPDRFFPSLSSTAFRGLDEDGQFIAQARLLCFQTLEPIRKSSPFVADRKPYRLFFLVETGPLAEDRVEIGSCWIRTADGEKYSVRGELLSDLGPNDIAVASAWCSESPHVEGGLAAIDFRFSGVKEWIRTEEGESDP